MKANGFDIDTTEGATAYLESEGVNVVDVVKKGLAMITRIKISLIDRDGLAITSEDQ